MRQKIMQVLCREVLEKLGKVSVLWQGCALVWRFAGVGLAFSWLLRHALLGLLRGFCAFTSDKLIPIKGADNSLKHANYSLSTVV